MLKGSALIFSDLHTSVFLCNCRTSDDNIGTKFKKPSIAILGMHRQSLIFFLYLKLLLANYSRTYFQTLFELILRPLSGLSWNANKCRSEEIRAGPISICLQYSLAHICIFLALVSAEEEFSIEKLNSNHSKDEVEEQVDDQDVEHVLQ